MRSQFVTFFVVAWLAFSSSACSGEKISGAASSTSVCDRAAAHLDSCLPGLASERGAACEGEVAAQAERALLRSCEQIFADGASGKADGLPTLKGVKIRKEGSLTYFSIPLARAGASDRGYLLEKMVEQFATRMGELNQEMIAHGLDLSSVLVGETADSFVQNYNSTITSVIETNT